MFSNEPAAITAAIRSGNLQQVQAEPRYQPNSRSASGVSAAANSRTAGFTRR